MFGIDWRVYLGALGGGLGVSVILFTAFLLVRLWTPYPVRPTPGYVAPTPTPPLAGSIAWVDGTPVPTPTQATATTVRPDSRTVVQTADGVDPWFLATCGLFLWGALLIAGGGRVYAIDEAALVEEAAPLEVAAPVEAPPPRAERGGDLEDVARRVEVGEITGDRLREIMVRYNARVR